MPWPGPQGPGWVNLHWKLTATGQDGKARPAWRGQPFKTAADLVNRAQSLALNETKAEDIYFCLSVQSQAETYTDKRSGRSFPIAVRDAGNATLLKAIWLDVDVKEPPKGYADLKGALDAINEFVVAAGLPGASALVASGGGVHVYWISGTPLTVDQWRPFAEGLKSEALRLGLRCDAGVTADVARILRMPGTYNRKIKGQPRAVKVLGLGCDYDFERDLAGLKAIGAPKVTAAVTKKGPAPLDLTDFFANTPSRGMATVLAADPTIKFQQETGQGRFTGVDVWSDLPLKLDNVVRECPHFADCGVTQGKGHPQGLWALTLLACSFFEDGERWAHYFSKGYPSYDAAETQAKYDEKLAYKAAKGLGWPSCQSFENEGCKLCATCVHRGQIGSPLRLAERVQAPVEQPTAPAVVNPQTQVVLTKDDLNLPPKFTLNGDGLICYESAPDPKTPDEPPVLVPIFLGQVISKPQVSNHRPPTLYFKYKQGLNFTEVVIPYTAYASDQSLATAFLEAGILTNPAADKIVRAFMRSWVGQIDLAFKRLNTAPLGWVIENGKRAGFAYGGKLFLTDGTEEDSGLAGEWFQKYVPSGDEAPIHRAMEILSERNNPALETLALQAWASPLVQISGLKGTAILWGYSKAGGRGKSTSLRTGTALWGAPDKCRMRGGATFVGLENTFDRVRNLPAQVDELTDEAAIDKIALIFQNLGEGGQGAKGTRNGGLRDDKFWQLNLTCGSNTSLRQYQARKGQDTNAKATRVFEIKVEAADAVSHSMTEVDQLIGSLEYNYGHLGLKYARYLALNHDAIDARYQALDAKVIADLSLPGSKGLPNEERFWKTTVTLTLLAAELANEICNKSYFHVDTLRQFLYDTYNEHRGWIERHVNVAGTGMHTEEAWNRLLGTWMTNQLITDTMAHGQVGRSAVAVNVRMHPDYQRGYTTKVHWLLDPPMVRIAYGSLVETLTELQMGTDMVDTFQRLYGGKVERKVFLAGIPVQEAKTRIKVWEIPVTPGHILYRQWADKVQAPEPANAMSAAATAQDVTAAVTAGVAQANKDMATVRSVT